MIIFENDLGSHQLKAVAISPYSRTSLHLRPLRVDENGREIAASTASGFFWAEESRLFLCTNWHVVTGIDVYTKKHLGTFLPNAMEVNFFAEQPEPTDVNPDQHKLVRGTTKILWDTEAADQFWVFPSNEREIDLAVKELEWNLSDHEPPCLNLTGVDLTFDGEVGEEVFVLGYPEGHAFERKLPLWKRGAIATDPDLDQNNAKQFYIDTIGNSGLSGAPVLLKKEMSLVGDDTGRVRNMYSFAGVYAGRLSETGIGSQVGRVYKAECVKQLISLAMG